MSPKAKTLWTTGRQLLGNLLPLLVSVPLLVYGISLWPSEGLSGRALSGMLGFVVVGWLATNFLGLAGSWGLRHKMSARLHRERPFDRTERVFVGFARPGYKGLLDPHEDVGFLVVHAERLEFFGSSQSVELPRSDVVLVRHRSNAHTWIGVGRWVSVEGKADGKPVRLLVEPRERATLIGNLLFGSRLRKRLDSWRTEA